jgi:AAA+ superfamily predicted ATPase
MGKKTVAKAIGFEVGKPLKLVNCAQLIDDSNKVSTNKRLAVVFNDAKLMDAVLVLDGIDTLLAKEGGSGLGAMRQVLNLVDAFPGLVVMTADLPPERTEVSPAVRSRLHSIVKFELPRPDTRALLWRSLLPETVPLLDAIDFTELGRTWELNASGIRNAIFKAAVKAALRPESKGGRGLRMKDLSSAANEEVEKNKGLDCGYLYS